MHKYFIEDFITESNSCLSKEELFISYKKVLAEFGYDRAVYTFVTDHPNAKQKAGHAILSNFPDDWMEHYEESGYVSIDPVIMQVHRTASAFTWHDLINSRFLSRKQKKILRESEEAGLNEGIGIPLYGPGGELAGVGLAGSEKGQDVDKNTLSKLQLITSQFHLAYCGLSSNEGRTFEHDFPKITDTECEVIKWSAIGKSAYDVGIILNISEETVKWHLKNIYEKLDANSKTLAITKAIRMGFLSMDMIKLA